MIKLLKKRSNMLRKRDFESTSQIEKKMTKLKDDKFDELIVPNTFWMTFMHVEAKRKALENPKIKFDNDQSLTIG